MGGRVWLLQRELGITSTGGSEPIYPAGSAESRHATLSIPTTSELKAWIDVYYPVLNTPLDRSLEILGGDGKPAWKANLEEVVDQTDPEAYKYADAIPAFHGLSANGEVEGKLRIPLEGMAAEIYQVAIATKEKAIEISAPTRKFSGRRFTLDIANNSSGSLGAFSFDAAFKKYPFTAPAKGKRVLGTFYWDRVAALWIQVGSWSPEL